MAASKSASRKSAAKKAAKTEKSRAAAKEASKGGKQPAAGKKATATDKRQVAAKKGAAPTTVYAVVERPNTPETLLAVANLDNEIAIVRRNLRELVTQATSFSGAADDERISQRIDEQEAKLALLRKQRAEIAPDDV